jgi:hypothetical protein
MSDEEQSILRLPATEEEETYWTARHEAAHVVVGVVQGRTLHLVTVEPDPAQHRDNVGSTVWIDDGPPAVWLDAITTWAGVIAGPDPATVQGDLDRLEAIGGKYDNYRWGALRVYRAYESVILDFATELTKRRTMTGDEVVAWLRLDGRVGGPHLG